MDPSRAMVLKLDHAAESSGTLVKPQADGCPVSVSVGLEWGL